MKSKRTTRNRAEAKSVAEKPIDRRSFLATAAAFTALGPVAVRSAARAESPDKTPQSGEFRNVTPGMRYRRLGRTNLMVSEVSLGCGFRYGVDQVLDASEVLKFLEKSLEMGVNYFDTSPDYATEAYLAHLAPRREKFFIATKVNTMSAQGAREEVENSLQVMRTTYLDVVQIHHQPQSDEWTGTLEALGELQTLKAEGKLRFVGFAHHSYDALSTVLDQHADSVDMILLLYNFLTMTDDAENIINLAHSKDIGTAAMKVFQGASVSWEERVELWQEDEASWARLVPLMDESTSVAQACVKYVLQNPFLSTALLGMRSEESVAESAVVPMMLEV